MSARALRRVVLGVGGGIAAYKSVSLLRLFTEGGHDVRVVPTAAALRFVGEPTWSALSGHPVTTDVWSSPDEVPHVAIARIADLVVVAPATADLLARAASGLADDLLTNVLLTARCPVLMAPAMHTEMWEHPATQHNVETLRRRGIVVLDPDEGRLAGQDTGKGRLPDPEVIHTVALSLLHPVPSGPLTGRRAVISAGGTREPLDPVRYLGNASSGRQGVALAEAARDLGAQVTLVAAHVEVDLPEGVAISRVSTAAELQQAMRAAAVDADVIVMAAAVADFRPEVVAERKIKKGPADPAPLRLVRTVDVLASLAADRPAATVLLVGFAAETGDADGDVLHHAERKLLAKGCDVLVVNDVSGGRVFGSPENEVVILRRVGDTVVTAAEIPQQRKSLVAHAIWDVLIPLLASVSSASTVSAERLTLSGTSH